MRAKRGYQGQSGLARERSHGEITDVNKDYLQRVALFRALLDTWAAPMSVQAGSRLPRRDSFLPRRSRLRRLTVAKQPNAIEWRPYRENAKNRLHRGSLEQDCRIDPVMLDVVILRAFGDRNAERVLPCLESRHLKAEFAHEG